jgi:hypothetical protein
MPKKTPLKERSVNPEDIAPLTVFAHSERWRDILIAILGGVAVISLFVLYVLLRG